MILKNIGGVVYGVSKRNAHNSPVFLCSLNVLSTVRNPFIENRRFMKPVKNVQYKYDWRFFKGKEYTHEPLRVPRLGGRDPETGKKFNQRIGGGYKFDYYWITTYPFLPEEGGFYDERVLEVRRDPNRSAFIAQVAGQYGRRWTLAVDGMRAGDLLRTTVDFPAIPIVAPERSAWPLGALTDGTRVCMVETFPGANDVSELRAVAAGTSVTITGRRGDLVMLKLPDQHEILVDRRCMATVGRISNPGHDDEHWGSMNMKRRMGIKQGSGLWHRKDGYCGRKVHPIPPPLVVTRREQPPERYKINFAAEDYHAGWGVKEFNRVLKGG